MFSFISMDGKGKPLVIFETVFKLISFTKTRNGLTATAIEDNKEYAAGIRHSDKEMTKLNIRLHEIRPKCN
jgi:hypothetical protein